MRHRKKTIKLGRPAPHRAALLAGQVVSLIESGRIVTTLSKAKATRSLAERMVTLGKRGTLADRRIALARLRRPKAVAKLFGTVAPAFQDRAGGYTRIVRLGTRTGDNAESAILEWVNFIPPDASKPKGKKGAANKAATPGKADKKTARNKASD